MTQPKRPKLSHGFSLSMVGIAALTVGIKGAIASQPQETLNSGESGDNLTLDGGFVMPEARVTPPARKPEFSPRRSAMLLAQADVGATEAKILTPVDGTLLDSISTSVTVQYPPDGEVELRLNGELVSPEMVGRTETVNGLKQRTWYGLILNGGDNKLEARAIRNGVPGAPSVITVKVPGRPKSFNIRSEQVSIPADGRSTATITGEFLDENGNPANWDAVVTLTPSSGEFVGADANPELDGFQVKAKKGKFTATLQSGLEAKSVRIAAQSITLDAYTQLIFSAPLRSQPLISGFVDLRWGKRGLDYYDRLGNFLPPDRNYTSKLTAESAVFALGNLGRWEYKLGYNSKRPINGQSSLDNRLLNNSYQATENTYPVYGDSSSSNRVITSSDQVYLRLERAPSKTVFNPDYLMWGDYNTEEFATASQKFSATTRSLHGFKANYQLGNLQLSGFYANNVEGFQRDSIVPDGTSGYYFLSRRLLTPGSEYVFLEEEATPLNSPSLAIQRKQLVRGADYEIDYDRGTLLFKQPLLRTAIGEDGTVYQRHIIATYQYEAGSGNADLIGGRMRYFLNTNDTAPSWIATSLVKENKGSRGFSLWGADAYISLGQNSKLVAEYASSKNYSFYQGEVKGAAWRLEMDHQFNDRTQGRLFYNTTEPGFSNNATISFVPGQTRYGGEITSSLTDHTQLKFSYEKEKNFGIAPRPIDDLSTLLNPGTEPVPGSQMDNELTTITAGVQQRLGKGTVNLDWLHRDRIDRQRPYFLKSNSDQLSSRLTYPISDRLSFTLQNNTTLSRSGDAVFGDFTSLGMSWKVMQGVSLTLNRQWFHSGQLSGKALTNMGIRSDYNLGTDTKLTGSYSIIGGLGQTIGQGTLGLKQDWRIAPGLKIDLSYEHAFSSYNRTGVDVQYTQPYGVGQSVSSLGFGGGDSYGIGIEYTDNPNWKASARFQKRTSSNGDNTVLSTDLSGKLSPTLTALMSFQQASSANQLLERIGDTVNLRLGLAYRDPKSSKWQGLLRYEYRQNPSSIPASILQSIGSSSTSHTFATEAIYAPDWRWEFYGKLALRTGTTYLARDFVSRSSLTLGQARITYRPGYNFDLVAEGRWISQPTANYQETGYSLEMGYYLTPELRLYGGYASGNILDPDFNNSRGAGGAYLGLGIKLNGLLNGFGFGGNQQVAPLQQQESLVKQF